MRKIFDLTTCLVIEKIVFEKLSLSIQSLEEGGKKALASKLGIDPTTVSRPRTRN